MSRRRLATRQKLLEILILKELSERATMSAARIAMLIDPDCDVGFNTPHVVGWLCDHPELVMWSGDGWMLRPQAVHA